eukprot:604602_1
MPTVPSSPIGHAFNRNHDTPKVVIGGFLDLCCPFSKRLFVRLAEDVLPYFEKTHPRMVQYIDYSYPQPWHPQSALMHEVALAVESLDPSAYFKFVAKVYSHQDQFKDEVLHDKSRRQIYEELAEIAEEIGIEKESVLKLLELTPGGTGMTQTLKHYVRFGRQNGVHVTPTITVNGIIDDSISSGWTLEQWKAYISEIL